ncbi:MAG: hypothetical protein A2W93_09895 [Bacteroidetes bacterium GWF2_43_63]|nr:MAG: hypothetical protein A2W94_00010 [Bacteroidetes bacterium GWE2_42_42]OFY56165.1 MAG: hypothetical protein A2W93_09895 [Bacteroidetes bacterium GWF2_43_63]HBG69736.1 hypothetical protein [Bacteroidales bacterium]HCB61112.1 hypothetical protein [Bacteroidales bacterium]
MKNDNDITVDVHSHFNRISFSGNQDEYSNIEGLDLFNGSTTVGFGLWYFSDNEYNDNDFSKLTMHLISFPGDTAACYPFPLNKFLIFKINRLTMEDLWIEHTDSVQNEYVIKFENNQQ